MPTFVGQHSIASSHMESLVQKLEVKRYHLGFLFCNAIVDPFRQKVVEHRPIFFNIYNSLMQSKTRLHFKYASLSTRTLEENLQCDGLMILAQALGQNLIVED